MPTKKRPVAKWEGSVFIWPRRVLFIGKAGASHDQTVHAIKVCVAFEGKLSLSIESESSESESDWKPYSVSIIAAQTKHSMRGQNAKCVALLYLLPQTEEARELGGKYLRDDLEGEELADRLLSFFPPKVPSQPEGDYEVHSQPERDYEAHWGWDCLQASNFCNKIIGELKVSPSMNLSEEVNVHVRRIIEYIYSELAKQLENGKFNKERFEISFIVRDPRLNPLKWDEAKLERVFKEHTGAVSLTDYVNQLELRAQLEQLGIYREEKGEVKLKEIAELVGLHPDTFTRRFDAILGISPRALSSASRFVPCPTISARIKRREVDAEEWLRSDPLLLFKKILTCERAKEREACARELEGMADKWAKRAKAKSARKKVEHCRAWAEALKSAAEKIRTRIS